MELFDCFKGKFLRSALFISRDAILSSVQPKSAFICETVAPALAVCFAANFCNPCADFLIPAALHASRKRLPKLSLISLFPSLPQMNVSSPMGPILRVASSFGKTSPYKEEGQSRRVHVYHVTNGDNICLCPILAKAVIPRC